ncbi:erythromycin esterase family protein [Nonomuraea sp. NPDC050790]|uniref:erythromycin esterase family protein n=1 Tax=Nonomuraea sp. NPDC050790 TaxID=3364371 RepID=UPI0037B22B54
MRTDAEELGAAVLRLAGERTRLLGLGEPTHGVEAFPRLRNELFRYLAGHAGFRSVAIESDCLKGLVVDDYVAGGEGDVEEVVREGFSHGLGASAAARELVLWMREHNHGRPEHERLRFYGFDAPMELSGAASPREAVLRLHAALAAHVPLAWDVPEFAGLFGADERWDNLDAMMDPARSIGRSADAVRLRLLADDLTGYLDAHAPRLAGAGERDWWRARLYGRTATGLLRYHAAMADDTPDRLARLSGMRDAMMAANLLAIEARETGRGATLVYAHNRHLQRELSTMRLGETYVEWWSAGAMTHARLGDRYAFFATGVGHWPGLEPPAPDTLEGVLSALPGERLVADPKALAATGVRLKPRISTDYRYIPLEPDHDAEGIVFLKTAEADTEEAAAADAEQDAATDLPG